VFGTPTARRLEDRMIAVMDLGDVAFTDGTRSGIATDVVASLGDLKRRSFAFARVLPTSRIIASRIVVPLGVTATSIATVTPAERAVRIESLLASVSAPTDPVSATIRSVDGRTPLPSMTVDELAAQGVLSIRNGARLDLSLASSTGPVRVFAPDGGGSDLGFDPLVLERHISQARRTEPGDVVFTHTPRPAAFVDAAGGSVVAAPARVLRLGKEAPVGPHLLAWTVNRQPASAREWRAWRIPIPAPPEQARLEMALLEVVHLRDELRQRLDAATALANELIVGVAAAAVTLAPEYPEGR